MMIPTSPITRFAAIGDIHAEDEVLAAVFESIACLDVEAVLATGDLANGPGSLDRCCEQLRRSETLVVAGNHDRWWLDPPADRRRTNHVVSAETRRFVSGLPRVRELSTVAGRLLLCHGVAEDDLAGVWPDHDESKLAANRPLQALLQRGDHSLIVNGHTHEFMVRRVATTTIVNAGTIRRDESPCFLVVDLAARRVQRHRSDAAGRFSRVDEVELPLGSPEAAPPC
jgi:predicted phosphodiesterase